MRKWNDISNVCNSRVTVDRSANYIMHISNGTMRYDYTHFSSHIDAIIAEYNDFGVEAGHDAMLCAYPDVKDAIRVWNKYVELGRIDKKDYWHE